MDIITFSYYATAGSFLFATITYWFDFIKRKSKLNKLKKLLNIELITIYNCVQSDVLKYDLVKEKNYSVPFKRCIYNNPLSESIMTSNSFIEIFKTTDEFCCFSSINLFISQIDRSDEKALQMSNKDVLDFFFEHRLVKLRDTLIELSNFSKFIDLSIMPVRHTATDTAKDSIEVYKENRNKEEKCVGIIKKYLPNKIIRILPDQYFGD